MKYEQFAANARKTYNDVCEIGGALSHAKSVLAAVPDLVGKNERLEKENRELKGENERLKADYKTALEHEDDLRGECMKLPLDADGEPIRIGDKMDVDGDIMNVLGYRLHKGELLLIVKKVESGLVFTPKPLKVRHFKYTRPDSWEKLEEDANKGVCDYAGAPVDEDGMTTCDGCRFQKGGDCNQAMARDMFVRAKKLAGIEEEAER